MWASEALLGAVLFLYLPSGCMETSKDLYSEVIVPRLVKGPTSFHTKKEMSYLIRTEGIDRIVHLQQQSFILQSIPVSYFRLTGDQRVEYPYIQDDCYYSGYVENAQESDVVVSTCAGLWGYIQVGNLKYEVRPIENSSAFQHLLYRTAPEQREPCRGVLGDLDETKRAWTADNMSIRSFGTEKDPGADALMFRYLEYYAVCDITMYQWEKSNETQVMLRILQITSILHHIYKDIGLHIVLVGVELWTEQDYSTTSRTLEKTLEDFYHYASVKLQHHVPFDHACIFTRKGEDGAYGMSWQKHFCCYNHVSVSIVKVTSSLMNDGVSAAHELGHALGFVHDDLLGQKSGLCDCNCTSMPGHCIMHSTSVECHRLSNCSKSIYYKLLQMPDTTCLLNIPTERYEMMCGNAVVEGSEECDCGKNEECQRDGCCRKNCTLKPGIDCLHGACCEACQFAPKGQICREAAPECDLPEYCTGSSADCPPDTFKQDGMPCGANDNCYKGQCHNLQQNCRNLFGPGANRAPLSCYKELNMRGDRTGNCGQEKLGYKKCREENVLCGRLQCTNIKIIPIVSTGQAIVQTPMDNVLCWGTEFHGGAHADDVGVVSDGSSCGAGKLCINRACVDLKVLNFDCNFSKCNHQGVCNNNKNCHCTYGWAPPNCSSRGYGGSVDSGPPPELKGSKGYLLLGCGVVVAFILMILTTRFKQYLPFGVATQLPIKENMGPLGPAPKDTGEKSPRLHPSTLEEEKE